MKQKQRIIFLLVLFLLPAVLFPAAPLPGRTFEPANLSVQSVFVRDMRLGDLAELLTRSYGAGFRVLVSDSAGEKRVSFFLADTDVEDMLRALCNAHGLWYRRSAKSGIVLIMTLEEYRRGLNLYADESVEVVPILYPAPDEIGETLARLFQDRVVWDPPPHTVGDDRPRLERALDRMDTIADRATLIDGGRSGVLGTGTVRRDRDLRYDRRYDRRTTLSGRDDRYARAGDSRTLDEVLTRQQRELEAQRDLVPGPDELETTGERPGLVYVSASSAANALVLRSSDAASLELVRRVIGELDRPRPQVLLEVKVLDILLDDEQKRGVDWLFQHRSDSESAGSISGGAARGITAEPGNIIRSSDPQTLEPRGTGIDPLAMVFSYVTADLRARIQLLEDEQRIRSLATPSLLVQDNEASRIFIGNEVTVLEKVEPQTDYVGTEIPLPVTTYTVTSPRRRIGTTLLITPKIHADRTVTLRILQEETRLGPERVIKYGQTADDQFTSQDVEERSVTTTILASDGYLVGIGGLVRERESERLTGVPVLMHIPILGELFRRTYKSQIQSELLVLVRPHVILAPGEELPQSKRWEELLADDMSIGDFLERPPGLPPDSVSPPSSELDAYDQL